MGKPIALIHLRFLPFLHHLFCECFLGKCWHWSTLDHLTKVTFHPLKIRQHFLFASFFVVVKHSDTRLPGFLRNILDKILLNSQSNGWMTIFGEWIVLSNNCPLKIAIITCAVLSWRSYSLVVSLSTQFGHFCSQGLFESNIWIWW